MLLNEGQGERWTSREHGPFLGQAVQHQRSLADADGDGTGWRRADVGLPQHPAGTGSATGIDVGDLDGGGGRDLVLACQVAERMGFSERSTNLVEAWVR